MPLVNKAKEKMLVRLAKAGNDWAFNSLVKAFEKDVFRFAYSFLGNVADSQDIVQEVFLKVHFALQNYTDTGAKFTTWLFAITRNQCLNHLKRNRIDNVELSESLAKASFEDEVVLKNDLYLALSSLPIEMKEAFVLVALQGFSYEEAGKILEISPGTVKSRVHNARMRLIEKMGLSVNKEMSIR